MARARHKQKNKSSSREGVDMKNFCLSSKKKEANVIGEYFIPKDVKKFIRLLKDPESKANPTHFCKDGSGKDVGVFELSNWWKEIDKLAGEGLI